MKSYRVVWEIDVEAPDEVAAAIDARIIMQDMSPDNIAHVFAVREMRGGECVRATRVDLDLIEGKRF